MTPKNPALSRPWLLLFVLLGAGSYHLAMHWPKLSGWFVLGYLGFFWQVRRAGSARAALWFGWLLGLLIMVPQTWFLWGIFSYVSLALWMLMSFWLGLLAALWQVGCRRWGPRTMLWLAPLSMLGVEFFRSEIWPLKFSWDTAGCALSAVDWAVGLWALGVYGLGATLLALVVFATTRWRRIGLTLLPLLAWPLGLGKVKPGDGPVVSVAGVQYENESMDAYLRSFDEVLVKHPATQWIVCSEYSFPGPPTDDISAWASLHRRYVSTGGVQMVPGQTFDKFYNTTFLSGPGGEVEHRQVKCVPIQFMDDGLPAPEQKVWESPWGLIGLCICYDMNYARVTDELVRQGAQALVIPAMDLEKWGYAEHVLSARLGATRAVEYGLPVFRLASSGISQLIQADGTISAEGSFPGQGDIVAGEMKLGKGGHRPLDRWLAWPAVVLTGVVVLWLCGIGLRVRFARRAQGR